MKFTFLKKHTTLVGVLGVAILLMAALASRAGHKNNSSEQSGDTKPMVQLLKIKDYAQGSHSVSSNGTVESLQQIDIKSQAAGKLTRVNVKVGDSVRAGQVLATIDQGQAGAALTSARGLLAQAEANYEKIIAGASSEDVALAQVALDNAKKNLETTKQQQDVAVSNALTALYNSGLTAVPDRNNPDTVVPTVTGSYSSVEPGVYQISVFNGGGGMRFQASGLETADGLIDTTPQALGSKGLFLQFSTKTLSIFDRWTISIPNTQAAAYTANNNAYQSAVQARTAAINGAQAAVDSAQAALDLKRAQARPADVAAARAAILSAQGQVQAAQVAYENTLIKTPFNGQVSALPVKFGDVISPGQKVASVVNQAGLQVKVFVSGEDLPFISPGAVVQIGEQKIAGTVSNAAASVDPSTRTGEVDITVSDAQGSQLTVGQNVAVVILGAAGDTAKTGFILPIQAVKLAADGSASVYTLNGESKAQEVSVTIGKVDGEHVEVTGGISENDSIVSNAYDISSGDTVKAQ